MASNAWGEWFRLTTWGESHGPAIGGVIDGCPAGVPLSLDAVQTALDRRAPGRQATTSERREPDRVTFVSGWLDGQTTGAPLAFTLPNRDARASAYDSVAHLLRPGHANYTYLQKYGCFDARGGGRASARETACRVAAGAVAEAWLAPQGIRVLAWLNQLGPVAMEPSFHIGVDQADAWQDAVWASDVRCPDPEVAAAMRATLAAAREAGDSWGGVVCFRVLGAPPGLGEPVYRKLEAQLAAAMLSLPASKGFELGEGFAAAAMRGSEHNDRFDGEGATPLSSNHAGGVLGGISTGMPIDGCVAFKPTSSIRQPQATRTLDGEPAELRLPPGSRHDPCVAIRAVSVVQAMVWLVLADATLMARGARA